MGAESFVKRGEGKDPKTLFKQMCDYYGRAPYSGSIGTCSLGRCTRTFNKATQENLESAREYIRSVDNGEKYVANYIDCGVKPGCRTTHIYMFYGWASC